MTPYSIPWITFLMVWLGESMDVWDPKFLKEWRKARRYKKIHVLRKMDEIAAIKMGHLINMIMALAVCLIILAMIPLTVFLFFTWRPF